MRCNKENRRLHFGNAYLPLALLSESNLTIELRRLIFCHAQRLPAIRGEMLRQHHDLPHMKRIMGHLPVDRLHH